MLKEKKKRRWGDRRDGRLIRSLDPYHALIPFIMKKKNDSCNFFTDSVEITDIDRFLREKRTSGYPGLGFLHLFIAAYVRVISQYPALNRFVSGQRIYSRDSVRFVMTVKLTMKVETPETSIKVAFSPADTIADVYEKLNAEIERVKLMGESTNTDDAAALFMKLPRLILKFVIAFIDFLDYFGKMPNSIEKASPFHGSMIITDVGSIGLPPIYHHLYNFGNLPVFIALGAKRKAYVVNQDGTSVQHKYVDYSLVIDERICDGFYFSQAYRMFKSILRDPRVLENPPESVVPDVE